MKTIPQLKDGEKLPDGRSCEVEAFLDTLKTEQARFLGSIRHACSLLGRESGQLAHVAATQSRLTCQFFDAQRSIMKRRADVDAEVALIMRVAEENAIAMVAAARAQAAAVGECAPAAAHHAVSRARADRECFDVDHRSARREVAELGVAVVRTMAEADSLAHVIDDAFEPAEPDGAALQHQLRLLLDDWWGAENREGLAVIDLARARAAMRGHIARIEAKEIIEAVRDADGSAELAPKHAELLHLMPPQVSAIMEQADSVSLQVLLDMLADSLDPLGTEFEAPEEQSADHAGMRRRSDFHRPCAEGARRR